MSEIKNAVDIRTVKVIHLRANRVPHGHPQIILHGAWRHIIT